MQIKVLGSGCSKCNKMIENTKNAVKELGLEANVEKIEEIKEIMAYGVMKTPAIVVDEEVKIKGRIAKVSEIKDILK